jgi:ketosteroid isomerase-like protein
MTQENVEMVRGGFEALNRRDIDAWIDGFHADVEVHDLPTIPDAPVYRSHDDLRNWVETMFEVWTEDSYYELVELLPEGDFVIATVRAHAKGRGSGVPIELTFFQVFEIDEGKVRRAWAFFEKDEAQQAAGLRE